GIASFGHVSGVHYQNEPEWGNYVGRLEETEDRPSELPIFRALAITPHQALVREMILQLKKGWLDRGYFQEKFGVDIVEQWQEVWSGYQQAGLATIGDQQITLSRDGLLQAD